MFERTRRAFRAFSAAEVREPTAWERSAVTPLHDEDFAAPDSHNPLKWRENWQARAFEFPPLLRCIGMVADDCSHLVASTVAVYDDDGAESGTQRDRENSRRLRHSVDRGVSPAAGFWLDVFTDLLTDGNALIIPERRDGVVQRLRLMRSRTARYQSADNAFYGKIVGGGDSEVRVPRGDMAHARMYGAGLSDGGRGRGWPFSDSPVRLLGSTLGLSDRIEDWLFRTLIGPKGSLVISPRRGGMSKGQEERLRAKVSRFLRGGTPLVTGAAVQAQQFGQSAREADIGTLLDHQLREVARVYGVPLPLIGSPVSAWGSGIEALAREHWKRAVSPRIDDVLAPLSHHICPPGRALAVDPLELIRGVAGEMAQWLNAVRPNTGANIATLDEARRRAMLPPATPEEREELLGSGAPAGDTAADTTDAEIADAPEDSGEAGDTGRDIPGANGRFSRGMAPPSPAELERDIDDLLAEPPTAPPQ